MKKYEYNLSFGEFLQEIAQLGWFNSFEIKRYKNVSEVIKSKSYNKTITTICFLITDYLKFIDSNSNSN